MSGRESVQVEPGKAVTSQDALLMNDEIVFPKDVANDSGRRAPLSGAAQGDVTHGSVKTLPAPGGIPGAARRLIATAAISSTGDGFSIIALSLLAVSTTRDPRLVALVFVAQRLPWVFGLWLARLVDACRRPARVLIAADLARALVLVATVVVVVGRGASIGLLAAAGFALGAGTLCHSAAQSTLLPHVATGADLAKANGYLSSAEGLGYAAVGPAAGALVFAVGRTLPFLGDAVSFVVSAWLVWPLRHVTVPVSPRERTRAARVDEPRGHVVRAVLGHPVLSLLLAQMLVLGFAQSLVLSVMPLFVRGELGVSAAWYGAFLGAAAVGGIMTGLVTPHLWAERRNTLAFVTGAGAAAGLAYVAIADQRSALAAVVFLFVFDGTVGITNTVVPTLRMEHAPPGARARTATLFRQAILGVQPIGAVLSGVLARAYGVRASLTVAGVVIVVCFALTTLPFRRALATVGA